MAIVAQITIIVLFSSLAVRAFLQRGMPRVGGKFGPLRTLESPASTPTGFSRTYTNPHNEAPTMAQSRRATDMIFQG
jgi:hypothetical protein